MPGTKIGGQRATRTIVKRYGKKFLSYRGKKGGSVITDKPKGFAYDRALASRAGKLGGKASRRTAIKQVEAEAKHTEKLHKTWKERIGL